MLGLDSSFNEANYGFQQFRAFLEAHPDLIDIAGAGPAALREPAQARAEPPRTAQSIQARSPRTLRDGSATAAPFRRLSNRPSIRASAIAASCGRPACASSIPARGSEVLADFLATLQAQPEPSR